MKVIYTEAAQQELLEFQEKQKRLLEELIAEKKYVYGDEALEVTASDIKESSERIRAYRPVARRLQAVRRLARLYVVIGASAMIGAVNYPLLKAFFTENREVAMVFVAGAMTVLAGLMSYFFYRTKLQRYEDMEKEVQRKLIWKEQDMIQIELDHQIRALRQQLEEIAA